MAVDPRQELAELEELDRLERKAAAAASSNTADVTPNALETAANATANFFLSGEAPRVAAGMREGMSGLAGLLQDDIIDPKTGKPIPAQDMFKPVDQNVVAEEFQRGRDANPIASLAGTGVGVAGLALGLRSAPGVSPYLVGGGGLTKAAIGQGLMGLAYNPSGRNDRGLELDERLKQTALGSLGTVAGGAIGEGVKLAAKPIKAASGYVGRVMSGMSPVVADTYLGAKDKVTSIANKMTGGGERALAKESLEEGDKVLKSISDRIKANTAGVDRQLLPKIHGYAPIPQTIDVNIDSLRGLNNKTVNKWLSDLDLPGTDVMGAPSIVKGTSAAGVQKIDAGKVNQLKRIIDAEEDIYKSGVYSTPELKRAATEEQARLAGVNNSLRQEINKIGTVRDLNKNTKQLIDLKENYLQPKLANTPISVFDSSNMDAVGKLQHIDELLGRSGQDSLEGLSRVFSAAKTMARPASGFDIKSQAIRPIGRGLLEFGNSQSVVDRALLNQYIQASIRDRLKREEEAQQ